MATWSQSRKPMAGSWSHFTISHCHMGLALLVSPFLPLVLVCEAEDVLCIRIPSSHTAGSSRCPFHSLYWPDGASPGLKVN